VGTVAYAESFVRAAKYLMASFDGKVTVRLGVPVLLGGVGEPALTRSLSEVAAWADNLPLREQLPVEARKAADLCMSNGGMGRSEQPEKIIMQLPVGLLTFEKKTFVSGPRLEMFNKINPFDTGAEQLIIDALISELNEKLGADLATAINYDRGGRHMTPDDDKTIIVVGNSHANYLATALAAEGYVVPVVETRIWRPNTMTVEEARVDLEAKIAASSNLVCIIYWCLDSAAYYSITDDSILPAVRDVSGKFHIHGSLIVAPSEMFNKSVKVCTPLFNIATSARKLLFSPLPRYWRQLCCSDTDHVSNLDETTYENTLFGGLDGLRRIIKDTLFSTTSGT
jgi:hypothetical protein